MKRIEEITGLDLQIERVSSTDLFKMWEEIISVYIAAFEPPPWNKSKPEDLEAFEAMLRRHLTRPGFSAVAARDGNSGQLIGFAYGYVSNQGQYFHDAVQKTLRKRFLSHWLSDCFELVEVAVIPEHQSHGIGGKLHDSLMLGLSCPRAILSTKSDAVPAMRMYLRKGWKVLVDEFDFPGEPKPYVLMGWQLPGK